MRRRTAALVISLAAFAAFAGVALAAEPGRGVDLSLMRAEYAKGHYDKAYAAGCKLLLKQPASLPVHYLLGNCYVKLGKLDKAVAEYKYCAQAGSDDQIGKYAAQALQQMKAASPIIAGDTGSGEDSLADRVAPVQPTPDKLDLQTLEYKERLLKIGNDLIIANKNKLQKQIERVQQQADDSIQDLQSQIPGSPNRIAALASFAPAKEQIQNRAALRISQLQEESDLEERKITAYSQSQVDKISSQKGNLGTQAQVGKGDLRMVQKGSNLFVRNYINFQGEPLPPPPPPELRALAKPLSSVQPSKKSSSVIAPSKKPRHE